jgi:hypothetical protein
MLPCIYSEELTASVFISSILFSNAVTSKLYFVFHILQDLFVSMSLVIFLSLLSSGNQRHSPQG